MNVKVKYLEFLQQIRNSYHPLLYLRRIKIFRWLLRLIDIPVTLQFNDIYFPVYGSFSRNLTFLLSQGTLTEEEERKNFEYIVKKNQFVCFYDVGANIGLYTFLFLSLTRDLKSQAILFEPDLYNLTLLKQTINSANLRNAIVLNFAVSDHEGTVNFVPDSISGATGSIQNNSQTKTMTERLYKTQKIESKIVTCVSLDSITKLFSPPDFMKIDVEGAESLVFSGAWQVIETYKPAIMFESSSPEDNALILKKLKDLDYKIFDMRTLEEKNKLTHNNLALHHHHQL